VGHTRAIVLILFIAPGFLRIRESCPQRRVGL